MLPRLKLELGLHAVDIGARQCAHERVRFPLVGQVAEKPRARIVEKAAFVGRDIERHGDEIVVAHLVYHVENAEAGGVDVRGDADEMDDTATLLVAAAALDIQPLQGVAANHPAVRVHDHDDGAALVAEHFDEPSYQLCVLGETGLGWTDPCAGWQVGDVDIVTSGSERVGEFNV